MQICTFDYEIVIGEDCSTDDSRNIILKYSKQFPGKFKLLLHDVNIGAQKNQIAVLQNCLGQYIAICEGDDYWTDPYKLQKQVDFLDNNADYVIHGGDALIHKGDLLTEQKLINASIHKVLKIEDFYFSNNLVTCTVMFRNILKTFPKVYETVVFGDWFLYVMLLNKQPNSLAYRSTEVLAAYRKHSASVMGGMSQRLFAENHFIQIIKLKSFLNYKNQAKEYKFALNKYFITCFRIEIDDKNYFAALKVFIKNFIKCIFKTEFKKYASYVKHNFKF